MLLVTISPLVSLEPEIHELDGCNTVLVAYRSAVILSPLWHCRYMNFLPKTVRLEPTGPSTFEDRLFSSLSAVHFGQTLTQNRPL